jgi:hypothetical protein
MAGRSARNRRVPPKGNPGEPGTQQQQFQTGQPVATIPWKTLILTTGITTLTGYVMLELLRGVHRYVKRRSETIAGAKNPKPEDERPPGALPNGTFQLPLPDGTQPTDFAGPPHAGFGSPRLADVNNPVGRLQHELHQYQHQMDARFNRIEQMLNQHYGATG